MIVIFALAIGTLGPAPDAPGVVDVDCVRTEAVVTPKRRKPGVVRRAPRLFKADPKPVVEPCEEIEPRLPPSAALPPPEEPFSPAPILPIEPEYPHPFPPLYVVPLVPLVPEEPPDTFAGPPWFAPPVFLVPPLIPPLVFVPAPPVPEPHEWMLLAAGLYLLHRKVRHDC